MGREQKDEPTEPAIADGTDASSTQIAVNHCIDALEEAGIIVRS